ALAAQHEASARHARGRLLRRQRPRGGRRTMSDARLIDTGYRRYDGPRLGAQHATVALWKHTLRRIFGFGRPARWKLLPVASVAIAYVPNIVFVGVIALIPDSRLRNGVLPGYAFTYGFITAAIGLFVIFVAPEALCPDRRSGIL